MLRYIFLKLSGFTGKRDFSISSSCNQMLMFRPSASTKKEVRREGRKNYQSKPQHKRSYSFPSRSTKSTSFLNNQSLSGGWTKSEPSDSTGLEPTRTKSSFQNPSKISKGSTKLTSSVKSDNSQSFSTNLTKKQQEDKDLNNKYHEMSLDNSERYELEVTRPRRSQSELIFNVFDYVAKDVDLTDYLQPNNLKPFGSTDNIYLPLLVSNKKLDDDDEPNYSHRVEKPTQDNPKIKVIGRKSTENPISRVNDGEFKTFKSYKPKEYTPRTDVNKQSTALDKSLKNDPIIKTPLSKSLDRTFNKEILADENEYEKTNWSESSIIEPPPFLMKREDAPSTIFSGDLNLGAKRSITNFRRVQPPWPAYSDHVRNMSKKTLVTYPTGSMLEDTDNTPEYARRDDKPKSAKKHAIIQNNIPQRRTLSTGHIRRNTDQTEDAPKNTKSSTYAPKNLNPVTRSLISLNTKGVNLISSHNYAKSSGRIRKFEPKPCNPPEKKKRCFLPSKVRLKPPKCITKPVCVKPEPCPPRADDCVRIPPKKLPSLKDGNCECYEPILPYKSPKLRRLCLKVAEEPRVCPCVPCVDVCCPETPVRADECAEPKKKKLYPYTPGECPCIEPPPMVDIPLPRLQKMCVPDEKCYPKEPCVVETCEDKFRADDCLKVFPKKLRPLQPKPCPCIDFKMKDVPKLKRLTFCTPDPPRICPPVKTCPPPAEKCARADDCAPQKFKKLPRITPGDCPCIEQPMVDVKPLPRLQCREDPEECFSEDPCCDFQRADWGCWEYVQDVEGAEKYDKCKKDDKDLNYKQKRKFNTDSRNSINLNFTKNQIVNSTNKKNEIIGSDPRGNTTKYVNTIPNTISKTESDRSDQLVKRNRASTLPRNVKTITLKSTTVVKQEKSDKKPVTKLEGLVRNNSLPTIFLLRELDQMDNIKRVKPKDCKINKLGSILKNITPPPNHQNNIRNLSTVVTNAKKSTNSPPGTVQSSSKGNKESRDCDNPNPKPCPKLKKCPAAEKVAVLRNCPLKEERSCDRERIPVCCEKKQLPNPAFSECMEEEIKPFSNTSQWSCDRKEYGFDPNLKNPNEPLDTVKNKKKFSTCAAYCQTADSPIVNYFSVRYSKTEMGQSRKSSGNIFDRAVKSSKENTHRDSSTLADAMSDVTECKVVKKDVPSIDEKPSKLLNQKSNYTVAGVSCRKMSTHTKGLEQLNTSHPNDHNAPKKDMSTLNNTDCNQMRLVTEDTSSHKKPLYRQYCEDNQKPDCKFPKKKSCPKFEMTNCPEKARETCHVEPRRPICQKPQAPYPSFSELMDDDIEDRMTECPVLKDKVNELQPKYATRREREPMLPPVEPHQGRIDPTMEEKCIREKLCMKNEGLTQDCKNFGAFVKPLKSKNFFKDKNKDCERIEELKKLGRWPIKRKFSTYASLESNSVRSFHALCKKSQTYVTGEAEKDLCQNHVVEDSKLRSVQLRTDSFQKWYRLKKMSNHPNFTKRYHTCSNLQSKKPAADNEKSFTTCTAKHHASNLSIKSVIYSKLKNKRLEKTRVVPKHLSNKTNGRGISTGKVLAKNKKKSLIKLPVYPKPIKNKPKTKIPNCPDNLKKIEPGESSKRQFAQDCNEENSRTWQPKYSSVPEVDTVSIRPYQDKIDSSWEQECLIHFGKRKKKGKSWDCSAVEKPFIRLNTSSLEAAALEQSPKQETMPCITCGEVFMPHNKVQMKTKTQSSCPKLPFKKKQSFKLPCPPEPKQPKQPKLTAPSIPSPALILWEKILNYFKAKPNCPSPEEWKKKALREKAEKAAKAAGMCLCEPEEEPQNICDKANGKGTTNASKSSSERSFSTRKGPIGTTTRYYSSGVNWENKEKSNKLIEKKKEKQPGVFKEETNYEDELHQKCPDPLLESIFKEAILSRNSLICLEKPTASEPKDKSITYSLNIIPSDINFLTDCIKEPSIEEQQSSDAQEYFGKIDALSEITYEELEQVKTKTLLKELDNLLKENEKSHKKN